ncbi:MAG: hypothetical protein IPO67_00320 [Deltaproteobacteria bacterium]|nr:hypothetical protein [Deltaproteobacteria bacterium]
MSVPAETVFQVIGAGRVGLALVSMGPAHLLRRGEPVLAQAGPIAVCARNDDLEDVLRLVPADRRGDLCFVQNGLLGPWFTERGLQDATRALLYFAVPSRGAAAEDGGGTVVTGPWAEALVTRLGQGGVAAQVVDAARFEAEAVEKLLWSCVFGLLAEVYKAPVGQLIVERRGEISTLTDELLDVAAEAGLPRPQGDVVGRLVAYSARIPSYQGGLKELPWRNGWFLARRVTPLHGALMAQTTAAR